jgi:hypothetical protein
MKKLETSTPKKTATLVVRTGIRGGSSGSSSGSSSGGNSSVI